MVEQVQPVKMYEPATLILLCESGLAELEGYVRIRMKKKGIMLNIFLSRKYRRGLISAYFFILGLIFLISFSIVKSILFFHIQTLLK